MTFSSDYQQNKKDLKKNKAILKDIKKTLRKYLKERKFVELED